MLACDGIWDCLSNEECCTKLATYIKDLGPMKNLNKKKLTEPVEKMLDDILAPNTDDGIGTDNMTAICIYFADNLE